MADTATHFTTEAKYYEDRAICEASGWIVSVATFSDTADRIMLTLVRRDSLVSI